MKAEADVSSPYLSNAMVGACILVDGHALIQNLGKPTGCRSFSESADIFSKSIFFYFNLGAARVDVVFDRYFGAESIKSQTKVKRGLRANKTIRKVVSNGLVSLPRVWAQFVSLSENKADLAAFLSEVLVKRFPNVPAGCEIVLGRGFGCTEKASLSSQEKVLLLTCDHEEADTPIILRGLEPTKRGYDHIMVFCKDTDVLLSQEVHKHILGFHALTGSDTTSSFAGFGKKSYWKMFIQHPLLLDGVGRDGPFEPDEEFICYLS